MKKPNIIAAALPHLCIILSCMMLTFLVIDHYNSAMVFINNEITKGIMFVLAILTVINAIMLIVRQRRDV